MPRVTPLRHRSDTGETYVELLVTLVIMGFAGVAIIGAIMTTIRSSTVHRNLANNETVVKSALEQAKYELQLAPSPLFVSCSSSQTASSLVTAWNTDMGTLWPVVPSGIGSYQAWVSSVECFSGSPAAYGLDSNCRASLISPSASPTNAVSSGCGNDVSGIVLLTVSVVDPSNQVTSLSALITDPRYGSSYSF